MVIYSIDLQLSTNIICASSREDVILLHVNNKVAVQPPHHCSLISNFVTHSWSNRLDPDQARYFVWPDLGPNRLQMLSDDDTSTLRVNFMIN